MAASLALPADPAHVASLSPLHAADAEAAPVDGGADPCVGSPPVAATTAPAGPAVWVEQLTLRAGDVALMHPLTLHSGTTNVDGSGRVRVMANGMARVTPRAFEEHGGARLMTALAPLACCALPV
jgi:hypothetical protein